MKALFIGQSYIDITFMVDEIPSGDDKTVARDYAVSFGQCGHGCVLLREVRHPSGSDRLVGR